MVSCNRVDLILFDIDGTLLKTGGAGREALDSAFLSCHGWRDATNGVHIAGSIDDVIVSDVAAGQGVAWNPADTAALKSSYLVELRSRCLEPGRSRLCPGVRELLSRLHGRAHVALLTGNWSEGAQIKLEASGLANSFSWGVYSEDATTRNGLVPVARERARAKGIEFRDIIVIGDTPADVDCARAGGARVIAVETGFAERGALERKQPDLQVRDLADGLGWILALIGDE